MQTISKVSNEQGVETFDVGDVTYGKRIKKEE